MSAAAPILTEAEKDRQAELAMMCPACCNCFEYFDSEHKRPHTLDCMHFMCAECWDAAVAEANRRNRSTSRQSKYRVWPWCPACRDERGQCIKPPAQKAARIVLARAQKAQENDKQQQEAQASRLQQCATAGCRCHDSVATAFRRLQRAQIILSSQIKHEFDKNLRMWRNRRYHTTLQHTMHSQESCNRVERMLDMYYTQGYIHAPGAFLTMQYHLEGPSHNNPRGASFTCLFEDFRAGKLHRLIEKPKPRGFFSRLCGSLGMVDY